MSPIGVFMVLAVMIVGLNGKLKKSQYPPHCTQVTKNTDFVSRFKFTYPVAYIQPGQHEAYQKMFCVHPSAVKTAVTTVCDWSAPPQVQFTLDDEYMHVVRQDLTGHFLGNAIITTYQLCSHNYTAEELTDSLPVVATTDE